MYSLAGYGSMTADSVRMDAYREALRRAVKPGSIVVDLGAGPGIMSCLALQLGAGKVYAIDPDDTLEIGRSIAGANGFDSRVEFHQASSDAVTLPERADVVVADLRGVLPAFNGNFSAMADARERFLKSGGTLIPQRDTLWVALAEAPKKYDDVVGGWSFAGLDLSIGRRMVANSWVKSQLTTDQLLSTPVQWAEVDYRNVREAALSGQAETEVRRGGTAHALSLWFDAELMDGIGFSNAPGQPEAIYGQAFFPLLKPVSVDCGDIAEVRIRADLTGDDYTWSWNTSLRSATGLLKADYRQSTFFGLPLAAENLRKRADVFVPAPNQDGLIDRATLDLFGSGKSLREIAGEIATRFPGRFNDWRTALDRVAALSVRYSE
jgi:protein arginine N-methyltransferase 1